MDKKTFRKIVKDYANLVVKNMIVNKIVLYGSYARGDNRKDRDIDVAVIVPRENVSKNILEDMAKLFKLTRDISADLEPILLSDEEERSGFLESILEYGEVVYSKWIWK